MKFIITNNPNYENVIMPFLFQVFWQSYYSVLLNKDVSGEEEGGIVLSMVFDPEEGIFKNAKKTSISIKHKIFYALRIKIKSKRKL